MKRAAINNGDTISEKMTAFHVARGAYASMLVSWLPKFLLVITCDASPAQPTVTVPATSFRLSVPTAHPSQEFSVIHDEITNGELVRVEHIRRDTQRQDGNPEVDEMGNPYSNRRIKQHDQSTHSHIDAGPSKSRVENGE